MDRTAMLDRAFLFRGLASLGRRAAKPANAVHYRFSALHRREQRLQELRQIEAVFGPVSETVRRRARDYGGDVLGSPSYWPELAGYAAVAGEFREGWLPQTYFRRKVIPRIAGPYVDVARLKTLSRRLFPGRHLPDVGYYCNGRFLSAEGETLPDAAVAEAVFAGDDRVVFKTDSAWRGMGVFVLKRDAFDPAAIRKKGNGVFQRFIRQHPSLEALSPGGVGTLRLITVRDAAGAVSLRASYLRMARAGHDHIVALKSVQCPFDPSSGQLGAMACGFDWTRYASHPDTGAVFAEHSVPSADRCIALAERLHTGLPQVNNIGWDITVDCMGEPILLEWNIGHGINFAEPLQGPCFADLGWERCHTASDS